MNKKIVISLALMAVAGASAIGGTVAFFSDTETSTGNSFTAGSLDLKIDNTCYYNGKACTNGHWGGDANAEACACTWDLSDLDGKVFFNLNDLKPGDTEEDTISLHVDNNPSWACAKITVDTNTDNTCTEPEIKAEGGVCSGGTTGACAAAQTKAACAAVAEACVWTDNCAPTNAGELPNELNFVWWADDGDNVLETTEAIGLAEGTGHGVVGSLDWMMNESTPWFGDKSNEMLLTIADKQRNFFGEPAGTPLEGGKKYYIGKAFCYGTLTLDPVADGENNSPLTDAGINCNGKSVTNATQSDKVTATLEFSIEQARGNEEFLCPEHQPTVTP